MIGNSPMITGDYAAQMAYSALPTISVLLENYNL